MNLYICAVGHIVASPISLAVGDKCARTMWTTGSERHGDEIRVETSWCEEPLAELVDEAVLSVVALDGVLAAEEYARQLRTSPTLRWSP